MTTEREKRPAKGARAGRPAPGAARAHAAPEGGSASERVRAALAAALAGLDIPVESKDIQVERPDDTPHGDLASNVALVMAKRLKRNPRELAAEIAKSVSLEPDFVDRVEVAGAGFINFAFSHLYVTEQVKGVVALGSAFGESDLGKGRKIQVEFVSANPTGPLV
ncbi:MAG: hypothetical protein ABR899_10015, partial [Candidatus Krumholzibacteriaceae bacterium]